MAMNKPQNNLADVYTSRHFEAVHGLYFTTFGYDF